MTCSKLSNTTLFILGVAGLFLLALSLAATSLIWSARQAVLAEKEAVATRFVKGAEAALNQNLLSLDVFLSSMDDFLGLSRLTPGKVDKRAASQQLHIAANMNMLVRKVALIAAQGRVLASSGPDGAELTMPLPDGFLEAGLAQPISTLMISTPAVSFVSSERVLYLARHIKLLDSTKVLAVAEIPLEALTAIIIQGMDISGLEVTLERNDGQLLSSAPTQDQLLGTQLSPSLNGHQNAAASISQPARLSGVPAIVVARPILYRDILIAASLPLDAALATWREQRGHILGVTAVFALMILVACGFSIGYLARLTQVKATITQSKATLDQALESMESGFMLLNAELQILQWNRRYEEMFPWQAGHLTALMPFRQTQELAATQLLPQASEAERHAWIEHRMALLAEPQLPHERILPGGRVIQITERRTPEGGVVINYQDVTELRRAADEIEQLAFYDPLTHLPNRRLLMDRLQQAMIMNARSGHYGALLFLDLDHFKTLNDTLGHDVGDMLLQQVAQRLKACVRDEDTVARLGGDEFVIMLTDLSEHRHEAAGLARQVSEKLMNQLNQPYQLAAHTCHSTSSIGVTVLDTKHQTAADLLKQADIAMYQVKSSGRNALCFFDPHMQSIIQARAQIKEDLHTALAGQQFELFYQPQLDLNRGMVGAEVLIRWRHPVRGLVSPAEFIPVAEESAVIVSIGHWVLRTACQQLAVWQALESCRALQLSVNVSARQFHQPDFVAQVMAVLQETSVPPRLLELELTESLVLDNVEETISKMHELRALGVRFSVDDFGTGHSSLAYLTRLPLDQLKIDQSFVRNIGIQQTDDVIVQTIIGMANNLGLEVIAEGVETQAQQKFLARHGCSLYQGYLYGKPTTLAVFEALFESTLPCTSD